MGDQLSFADYCEYRQKRHQTRKEKFLTRIETLIPWLRIEAVIEPYYPKPGNGRRIFEEVNSWLIEASVLVKEGTLMDATIIEA